MFSSSQEKNMITKECKKPNFSVVINVVKPVSLVLDAVVQKDKAKAEHASLLVLPFPIHAQPPSYGRTTVGHGARFIPTHHCPEQQALSSPLYQTLQPNQHLYSHFKFRVINW